MRGILSQRRIPRSVRPPTDTTTVRLRPPQPCLPRTHARTYTRTHARTHAPDVQTQSVGRTLLGILALTMRPKNSGARMARQCQGRDGPLGTSGITLSTTVVLVGKHLALCYPYRFCSAVSLLPSLASGQCIQNQTRCLRLQGGLGAGGT